MDVGFSLNQAVLSNDLAKLKLLIVAGANPNIAIQDGRTPLHLVFLN
jgi:ankyrin repeat protein